MTLARIPIAERLWPKVERTATCWNWTGATVRGRYGKISLGGQRGGLSYVHRVVYEMLVGPIPPGMQLDHLCRTTLCVNPAHLEPVSGMVNAARTRRDSCSRGHDLTGKGLYVSPRGARGCVLCRREVERRRSRRPPP